MIWLRYIALKDVGEWLAKGWTIADDLAGTHHGHYSIIMRYVGEGEPG